MTIATADVMGDVTGDAVGDVTAEYTAAYAEYTAAYGVMGMSCGHCVAAVTEGLAAVPGVVGVEIDLAAKRAIVRSAGALEVAVVRDAIEGAGYQLA